MKKRLVIVSIAIMLLVLLLPGCTRPQPRVGVLDMERVLKESERAQELKSELSRIGDDLEKNYSEKKEELSGEQEKEQLNDIYMEFVDNKQKLEGQLNEELNEVLKDITDEQNIEIVLYKKYVKYGGVEVTEETIEQLDREYSKGGNKDETEE